MHNAYPFIILYTIRSSSCMCVWNVWTNVKLLILQQGDGEDVWGSIQQSSSYDPRISLGTLSDVPAIFDFSVNGMRPSQQPRHPHSISCTFAAICIFDGLFPYLDLHLSISVQHSELRAWMDLGNLREGLYSTFQLFYMVIPMDTSSIDSFRSQFSLVLSGFAWMGFSSRWITLLILSNLVWFPWWLRHGAMDPFERTPLWETWHRLDFWIDTFNLVIHLSKVEQLARSLMFELLAAVLGNHLFYLAASLTAAKPPFFQLCSRDWYGQAACTMRWGLRHVLFLRCGLFGIWWG